MQGRCVNYSLDIFIDFYILCVMKYNWIKEKPPAPKVSVYQENSYATIFAELHNFFIETIKLTWKKSNKILSDNYKEYKDSPWKYFYNKARDAREIFNKADQSIYKWGKIVFDASKNEISKFLWNPKKHISNRLRDIKMLPLKKRNTLWATAESMRQVWWYFRLYNYIWTKTWADWDCVFTKRKLHPWEIITRWMTSTCLISQNAILIHAIITCLPENSISGWFDISSINEIINSGDLKSFLDQSKMHLISYTTISVTWRIIRLYEMAKRWSKAVAQDWKKDTTVWPWTIQNQLPWIKTNETMSSPSEEE